ncbi:PREDICTED: vascular endothelial growth factor C [Polistes dominula]|uniref:Vascular endothelial growth factor C n=1 Tax=Polistes dominula TaxID=743375 RepID=A0ABM1IYL6_POLDO|nr:PREDICTED: vascular endothelial growth factor C [Polistes dominula]
MSYFEMKLAVFLLVCGIVFSQSDNRKIDNSERIVFPEHTDQDAIGNVKRSTVPSELDDNLLMTSLEIAQKINSMSTYEEFLKFINVPPEKKVLIASRIGGGGEKSNAERPKPAGCIPENQTVSLRPENKFSTFYYPSCTRVKRCGGCCGHYLLSCQPIETETRNFEVIVSELNADSTVSYKNKEIIPIEEHTKCKCDCKIKAQHCNKKQAYRRNECSCVCMNIDEENKCKANKAVKIWDSETCTCACRENEICSTGFYFDNNTCRCRQVPILSRFGDISRKSGYRFDQTERPESVPPVIVHLDASDPRRQHKDDPEYK